jgi:hypothetical protein
MIRTHIQYPRADPVGPFWLTSLIVSVMLFTLASFELSLYLGRWMCASVNGGEMLVHVLAIALHTQPLSVRTRIASRFTLDAFRKS